MDCFHAVLLQSAGVREDRASIDALVAEFNAAGVPVPDYKGKPRSEPKPLPEREPVLFPMFDERGQALNAVRVRPVRSRATEWDQFRTHPKRRTNEYARHSESGILDAIRPRHSTCGSLVGVAELLE